MYSMYLMHSFSFLSLLWIVLPGQSHSLTMALAWLDILKSQSHWLRPWLLNKFLGIWMVCLLCTLDIVDLNGRDLTEIITHMVSKIGIVSGVSDYVSTSMSEN